MYLQSETLFEFKILHSLTNADVNECENAESNDCGLNTVCINTNGSYSCRCKVGFQGDGADCTGKVPLQTGLEMLRLLFYFLKRKDENRKALGYCASY